MNSHTRISPLMQTTSMHIIHNTSSRHSNTQLLLRSLYFVPKQSEEHRYPFQMDGYLLNESIHNSIHNTHFFRNTTKSQICFIHWERCRPWKTNQQNPRKFFFQLKLRYEIHMTFQALFLIWKKGLLNKPWKSLLNCQFCCNLFCSHWRLLLQSIQFLSDNWMIWMTL